MWRATRRRSTIKAIRDDQGIPLQAHHEVAEHLRQQWQGVFAGKEVSSVAVEKLLSHIKVAHNDDLAEVISDRMRHLEGIVETETMIAFRAYSKKELEAGFELGLD